MSQPFQLVLTVTPQGEPPDCAAFSLWSEPSGVNALSVAMAEALAEWIGRASGRRGAVLTWLPPDDPLLAPSLPETHTIEVSTGDGTDPKRRYALYRPAGTELATALRTVWNAFDSLRILPADDPTTDEIVTLVELDADPIDEERVGLDWGNRWYFRQQNSGCLALLGGMFGTLLFALRVTWSDRFRRQLMDPFLRRGDMRLAQQQGALFWKTGHDDVTGFGGLSAKAGLAEHAVTIFQDRGIVVDVRERSRESHWRRDAS